MRCESKNRDFKVTAHVSLNRQNICKTHATKSQLRLSRRFQRNECWEGISYKQGFATEIAVRDLPDVFFYKIRRSCYSFGKHSFSKSNN